MRSLLLALTLVLSASPALAQQPWDAQGADVEKRLVRDIESCAYFSRPEIISEARRMSSPRMELDSSLPAGTKPVLNVGEIRSLLAVVTPGGRLQKVFTFSADAPTFKGDYVAFFLDRTHQMGFTNCITRNECPKELTDGGKASDPLHFIKTAPKIWPGMQIITSQVLIPTTGAEYANRDFSIYPAFFRNILFFYFFPPSRGLPPNAVVGTLGAKGEFVPMCTY